MSALWYAVIVAFAAYLLLSKPVGLASWAPLPKLVRLILGVILLLGSGSFVFIAVTLGVFLGRMRPSGAVDNVGLAVVLLLLTALGLAMGYIGARLIAMKNSDSLFRRPPSDSQLLVQHGSTPHTPARRPKVIPEALEQPPADVDMIREIPATAQVDGELPRRWFFSHEQDLLVWFGPDGTPSAFQLAYGKYRNEHALRWKASLGFSHYVVDDGEGGGGGSKQAPLLEMDGAFPAPRVLKRFLELSAGVPREIVEFIAQRLREHPEYRSGSEAGPILRE